MIDEFAKSLSDKHRAYLSSIEFRVIVGHIRSGRASDAEILSYIQTELYEAMDCLEPITPKNGRFEDGWHASACVLRAWAMLIQHAPRLAKMEATIYELRKHLIDLQADHDILEVGYEKAQGELDRLSHSERKSTC